MLPPRWLCRTRRTSRSLPPALTCNVHCQSKPSTSDHRVRIRLPIPQVPDNPQVEAYFRPIRRMCAAPRFGPVGHPPAVKGCSGYRLADLLQQTHHQGSYRMLAKVVPEATRHAATTQLQSQYQWRKPYLQLGNRHRSLNRPG